MKLFLGGKGGGFPLGAAVGQLLGGDPSGRLLKIGVPYLSDAGLEAFSSGLGTKIWPTVAKTWLVGIHHGITEPRALRAILSASGSSARVFLHGRNVIKAELSATPIFHAKVVGVEDQLGGRISLTGVVVSSANITRAALARNGSPVNFEAGAALPVQSNAERLRWAAWWMAAWKRGIPLTHRVIDTYEKLRLRFLDANHGILNLVDPPSRGLLTSATNLWIEAGPMSTGWSNNQIEFNKDLADFFGPATRSRRILTFRIGNQSWNDRPLSPKRTTLNVDIWRLSLPTEYAGGVKYTDKVIHFTRDTENPKTFDVEVADPGSAKARAWRRQASATGYVGRTGGKREFGLW